MKTITTIAAILLMTITAFAQPNSTENAPSMYHQKMGQLLGQFGQCQSIEDYNKMSNEFTRVAQVEKEQWLPLYYAAQCKVLMSFMTKDVNQKDAYLDEVEKTFDEMEKMAPTESEIPALKSMFYSARLVVNPMTRGQEYMAKSNAECKKSLALNPNNNRAKYMMIKNFMGFASFFGSDTTDECKQAADLMENWDTNETDNRLMPHWGKNQLAGVLKSCK